VGSPRPGTVLNGKSSALPRGFVDMLGQTIGGWVVKEKALSLGKGATWWCACELCNLPRLISGNQLRKPQKLGRCKHCFRQRPRSNIVGQTRGTWKVLARVANPKIRWRCACVKCGFEREIDGSQLAAEAPPCSKCPKPEPEPIPVPPFRSIEFNPDEPGVAARCRVCRSMAMFRRARCGVCGASGSAETLPHVDGRRCG